MDRGLYVAASGALTQQRVIDTATSNLSNANVSGFKKDFPIFKMTEATQGLQTGRSDEAVIILFREGFYRDQLPSDRLLAGSLEEDRRQPGFRYKRTRLHGA